MKKFLIAIVAVLMFQASYSQVPGYVGRKFSVKLGTSFIPAFFNPVYVATGDEGGTIGFYGLFARYNFNFDYVVSRRQTIGLAVQFAPAAKYLYVQDGMGNGAQGLMGVNGYNVGVYFRHFFGRYVAPVGNYYKLEIGGHIYQLNDRGDNFPDALMYPELGGTAYIINSFGRQHIYSNILTLDYGLDLGFVLPPYSTGTDGPAAANFRLMQGYAFTMYCQVGLNFGKTKFKKKKYSSNDDDE